MTHHSPRFKWQANWTIFNGEALHVNGVAVSPTGRLTVPPEAQSALEAKHGPHNTPRMLARLAVEGVAVWHAHQRGLPLRHAKIPASSKT